MAMSTNMSRRNALRRGAAFAGGLGLATLPPVPGMAQAKTRVRFAGYVESQEQLKQTLAGALTSANRVTSSESPEANLAVTSSCA